PLLLAARQVTALLVGALPLKDVGRDALPFLDGQVQRRAPLPGHRAVLVLRHFQRSLAAVFPLRVVARPGPLARNAEWFIASGPAQRRSASDQERPQEHRQEFAHLYLTGFETREPSGRSSQPPKERASTVVSLHQHIG